VSGRQCRSATGYSVAELLAVVAVGGVLTAATVPTLGGARERLTAHGAARTVAAAFREASALARLRQAGVGWEVVSAPLSLRLVRDGDRDGVRRDDVDRGVDLAEAGWRPLGRGVGATVGCSCPDVDGAGRLEAGERGLRFGLSDFVSFSGRGSASPGTLYLSAGGQATFAVRVLGNTARVRVFEYQDGGGWAER
jgi:hypothetical protein